MNDFITRTAQELDAAQIAKVQVETWHYAYKGLISQEHLDSYTIEKRTQRWKQILTDKNSINRTLVAELGNQIVGFCSVGRCRDENIEKKTGELLAIYIDQHFMNKGIGSALMKENLAYLKQNGFAKAILWVLSSNNKARNWYEERGWTTDGTTKEHIRQHISTNERRYFITL